MTDAGADGEEDGAGATGDGADKTGTDAWFAGLDPDDEGFGAAAATQVRDGRADAPADWPRLAVEAGVAADEAGYYDRLREATLTATRAAVREAERADDRQLVHAIRAADDRRRILT